MTDESAQALALGHLTTAVRKALSTRLLRRPRLANVFHAVGMCSAYSGTTPEELACLAKYAAGRRNAAEIGTHMGVSAGVIARALDADARLYCIDPWIRRNRMENPSLLICRRELNRLGVSRKIVFLRGYSAAVGAALPDGLDFLFIDGDHSRAGIECDWGLALSKVTIGGIVCLHDTSIPPREPSRRLESVEYFHDTIRNDSRFSWLEECHSMNVLERLV